MDAKSLPAELQDDFFQALSETGMYDLYPELGFSGGSFAGADHHVGGGDMNNGTIAPPAGDQGMGAGLATSHSPMLPSQGHIMSPPLTPLENNLHQQHSHQQHLNHHGHQQNPNSPDPMYHQQHQQHNQQHRQPQHQQHQQHSQSHHQQQSQQPRHMMLSQTPQSGLVPGGVSTVSGGLIVGDQRAAMPDLLAGVAQAAVEASSINAAASEAALQAAAAITESRSRLMSVSTSRETATPSKAKEPELTQSSGRGRKKGKGASSSGGDTPRGGNKGLRHFSLKVCEKVQSKGKTSYNEVADELVEELRGNGLADTPTSGAPYDEKNIRRRVYDALNVLMAMDIIVKEKKDITWKGLPSLGEGDLHELQETKDTLAKHLESKQVYLQELVEQHAALKALMDRNKNKPVYEKVHGTLHLPFVLVQTERDATVEVFISDDMQNVQMDFGSAPFQIHDDGFLLKQMIANKTGGLGDPQPRVSNSGGVGRSASAGANLQIMNSQQTSPMGLSPHHQEIGKMAGMMGDNNAVQNGRGGMIHQHQQQLHNSTSPQMPGLQHQMGNHSQNALHRSGQH